ncbi:hypothetical protein PAXRUDRAFT_828572, partial [Paxillus rubicundulus Ve08.2h10]
MESLFIGEIVDIELLGNIHTIITCHLWQSHSPELRNELYNLVHTIHGNKVP